jgi:hypothetical protein
MQRLIISALMFLLLGCGLVGIARTRDLTEREARELVITALGPHVTLPNIGLEAYKDPDAAGFYVFEATASPPAGQSPIIGHYAVNRATGDVWELVVCRRVNSKALKKLQDVMRKGIRLSREELGHLGAMAPCQP